MNDQPHRNRPRHLDLETGRFAFGDTGPAHSIPLAPTYVSIQEIRAWFSPEELEDFVIAFTAARRPPPFEEELAHVTKLFPRNVPARAEKSVGGAAYRDGLRQGIQDLGRQSYAQAVESDVYRRANELRLGRAGATYYLANYTADGPNLLVAAEHPTEQDEIIIWSLGFMGELLVGILAVTGIKVKGGNQITQLMRKLWKNVRVRDAIKKLLAGITAAGLLAFLKTLYEEGLLGDALLELVDVSFWGLLSMIAMIALNLVPGAGQAKLLAGLGLLGIELGVKLLNKPGGGSAGSASAATPASTAGATVAPVTGGSTTGAGPAGTTGGTTPSAPTPAGGAGTIVPSHPAVGSVPAGGSATAGTAGELPAHCRIWPKLLAAQVKDGPDTGRVELRLRTEAFSAFERAAAAPHDVEDITLENGSGAGGEETLPCLTLRDGCSSAFTLRVTVDYEVYNHITMIDSGSVTLTEHGISCGQPRTLDRRFEIKRDAMEKGSIYVLVEAKSQCVAEMKE